MDLVGNLPYFRFMKEVSEEKFQISASVKKDTIKFIKEVAAKHRWHFSETVDFLLEEAKLHRQSAKLSNIEKSE